MVPGNWALTIEGFLMATENKNAQVLVLSDKNKLHQYMYWKNIHTHKYTHTHHLGAKAYVCQA